MLKMTPNKKAAMDRLSTENGLIEALAIDQRGALKKMISALGQYGTEKQITEFKTLVSRELTPYASAILLDPEYGIPAANVRVANSGLLLAYEKTGYDVSTPGRMPDLLEEWSVRELKENGADGIKFLLYYDVDETNEINKKKQRFIERLGSECQGEDLPFYLELLSYDAEISDTTSKSYAKLKPKKVINMMKEFSKTQYKVDVLKVEVPVNMKYVEGFGEEDAVYTRGEALDYFKQQSDATHLPFIFLSAGVSAKLFQDTLRFAKESGSTFNGVLCGRATWKDGVVPFVKSGEIQANQWFETAGKDFIQQLNEVVEQTASSWHEKVEVSD